MKSHDKRFMAETGAWQRVKRQEQESRLGMREASCCCNLKLN